MVNTDWLLFIIAITQQLLLCTYSRDSSYSGNAINNDNIGLFYRDQVSYSDPAIQYKKFRSMLERYEQELSAGLTMKPTMIHMENAEISNRNDIVTVGRADGSRMHSAIIHCKSHNMDVMKDILYQVSDPRSSKYGQHLTREEIREYVNRPDSVNHVLNYLTSKFVHVTKRSEGLQVFLTAEAPISTWEEILDTEFYEFHFTASPNTRFVRAHSYSIPEYLDGHVSAIFRTVQFPDITNTVSRRDLVRNSTKVIHERGTLRIDSTNSEGFLEDGYVTPQLLNNYYNIDSNAGNNKVSQAVYETAGQSYDADDLTYFQEYFELPKQAVSRDINPPDEDACGSTLGGACLEANLHLEYLMGVAWYVPTTYYYWEGDNFLLDWAQEVSVMEDPPLVITITYITEERNLPRSYKTAFENVAILLGTLGITLVVSSGDDGAVSPLARTSPLYCGYSPTFPASSPYVVVVGATQGPETEDGEEVSCSSDTGGIITSGGGFSSLYPLPDWQRSYVENYTATVKDTDQEPHPGYGAGRGYPDVSLMAHNYIFTANLKTSSISGTSASAPVFAAMLSLINAARADAGKSRLGWINPSLYYQPELWSNDIKKGNNRCAALHQTCCSQGYSAVAGWDPVTGLGSVDFAALKAAFLTYGDNLNSPTAAPTLAAGEPTGAPANAPTYYPTAIPSASPTLLPGWLLMADYEDSNCEGTITDGLGVPTGRCMIEYNKLGEIVGSTMYTCDGGAGYSKFYSDLECSNLFKVTVYGMGCAYFVEDYYNGDTPYSTFLQCVDAGHSSSGRTDIPPLPSYDGTYVVAKSFDTFDGCQDERISEFGYYRNGYCFNSLDAQEPTSYKYDYPFYFSYKNADCVEEDIDNEITFTEFCELNYYYFDISPNLHRQSYEDRLRHEAESILIQQNDESEPNSTEGRGKQSEMSSTGVSTNNYYDQFFGSSDLFLIWQNGDTDPAEVPSNAPTFAPSSLAPTLPIPTQVPTQKPTQTPSFKPTTSMPTDKSQFPKDEEMEIFVVQFLNGIDAATFNNGGVGAENTFTHTVALTTDGRIQANQVIITDVVDSTSSSRESIQNYRSGTVVAGNAVDLLDGDVQIEYTLKFKTFEAGFETAVKAFEDLSTYLLTADSDPLIFDAYFHNYASVYGATALLEATADGVLINPEYKTSPVVSEGNDSGDSADALGGVDVIAIAVTVVLFVVAVVAFTLCCMYREPVCGSKYGTIDGESFHQGRSDHLRDYSMSGNSMSGKMKAIKEGIVSSFTSSKRAGNIARIDDEEEEDLYDFGYNDNYDGYNDNYDYDGYSYRDEAEIEMGGLARHVLQEGELSTNPIKTGYIIDDYYPYDTPRDHFSGFTPRSGAASPRDPGYSPRTARSQLHSPRDPRFSGRNPALSARSQLHSPRDPRLSGRNPALSARSQLHSPRDPTLTSRNPAQSALSQLHSPRDPRLSGRNPDLSARSPEPTERDQLADRADPGALTNRSKKGNNDWWDMKF